MNVNRLTETHEDIKWPEGAARRHKPEKSPRGARKRRNQIADEGETKQKLKKLKIIQRCPWISARSCERLATVLRESASSTAGSNTRAALSSASRSRMT